MRDLDDSGKASKNAAMTQPGITAAITSVPNPDLETLLSNLISGNPEIDGAVENGHMNGEIARNGEIVRNGEIARNGEITSESEEEKKMTTLEELSASLKYLGHQVSRIMDAMKIEPCACASCKKRDGSVCQSDRPETSHTPTSQSSDSNPPVPNGQVSFDTGTLLMQIFQNQQNGSGHMNGNALKGMNGNALNTSLAPKAPLPPSLPRISTAGRRSKYCTPEEKRLVAEYAHLHGAAAAARRFNIPPAIASYYYKREIKNIVPGMESTTTVDDISEFLPSHSGEGLQQQDSTPSTPTPITPLKKESFKMDLNNPAHTSGSPGFLRGRGRGRPKLIGDELDAELVEYMVNVKNCDPNGHLTASQALELARDFIMQKQPGLLAEQGGHVNLKITWAMKLVGRIAERQKEMEMGLQAGTLASMQKQASLSENNTILDHQRMSELLKQMSANALANVGNGMDFDPGASGEEGELDDDNISQTAVGEDTPLEMPPANTSRTL
uniref:HTH psq-type domain-containing protein n=1 Tax=Steinernema glaseri TaxID=37863 RepID=A0A1I7ZU90_9BILA